MPILLKLISLNPLFALILATALAARAAAAPDTRQSTAEYAGQVAAHSTLTMEVNGAEVKFTFSEAGWSVGPVTVTKTGEELSVAATGTAGDRTLAVSGKVGKEKAEVEIRVGVGGGAKVGHVALKRKKPAAGSRP